MNIQSLLNKSGDLDQLNYLVLIEEKAGLYSATVWGLPDCKASGVTREEALKNIHQLLIVRLEKTEIVSLEIELPKPEHPWMKFAGKYKDDPYFDEMLEDIKVLRQERDAELAAYYRQLDTQAGLAHLILSPRIQNIFIKYEI